MTRAGSSATMAVAPLANRVICALAASILGVAVSARAAEPLPTLPVPPLPASSSAVLAAHLAKGLYGGGVPDRLRFALSVRFDKLPDGLRPDGAAAFVSFFENALEAAMRQVALPARIAVKPGAVPPPTFGARTNEDPAERVDVELRIQSGHVSATARRRVVPRTVWDAFADPEGAVLATAFANVTIDLELRSLLGLGRREVRLDRMRIVPVGKRSLAILGTEPILDLAIVDLDGDRLPELAVLQPDGVRVVRWEGGGFSVEVGSLPFKALAPAAGRARQPFGRLVPVVRADGTTVLVAASSDRAEPIVVTLGATGLDRAPLSFQRGFPLYATGTDSLVIAPWPDGFDALSGGLTEARFGTASARWVGAVDGLFDVRGSMQFVLERGRVRSQPVLIAASTGGRVDIVGVQTITDAGTVSGVADLDADGKLELMTTSTVISGPDRVALFALGAPAGVGARPIWSGTVAAPVTAMAFGDVDRDGYLEAVVAIWDGRVAELVVVVPA